MTNTPRHGRTALMLSGGAPNFPMMAGALLALYRNNVEFDLISMTGAGSVLGLIYLSPKNMTREEALLNTVNYGVSDAIYETLPVNYKMFQKGGYQADKFREYCNSQPYLQRVFDQYPMNDGDKLRSDALQFALAAMCPTDLNRYSTGLCAHAPFIEQVVDFAKLKQQPIDCVLNAYCIEDQKIREWRRDEIDVHHFRASLSFPFLYPPYRLDGKHYFEGAAYEALNLTGIGMDQDPNDMPAAAASPHSPHQPRQHTKLFHDRGVHHLDRVIVFDIMTRDLVTRPGNLWAAYAQSIILPLVANAQNEEKALQTWQQFGHLFGPLRDVNLDDPADKDKPLVEAIRVLLERVNVDDDGKPIAETDPRYVSMEMLKEKLPPQIYKVKFEIPAYRQAQALEWKRSNLTYLFNLGYATGQKFVADNPELRTPAPQPYYDAVPA